MKSIVTFVLSLCVLCVSNTSFAGMVCEVKDVFSTPTEVLAANSSRKLLVLQAFSAQNLRCTDGSEQTPALTGTPGFPYGVGFVVPRVTGPDPALANGVHGGYVPVILSGTGVPTGPIVCIQKVASAPRQISICEND